MEYPFSEIESRWQLYWKEHQTYHVSTDPSRPKYYVLDMFPYPSGAGLHVGHPLGYIASDIYSRYKRHQGFNVLHPMGYDAFGLPAEQYAIQTGQHPAVTTAQNITRYRTQLDKMGFSFDWSREVQTCDPEYYRWTQWIFLKLFGSWYNRKTDRAEPIESLTEIFNRGGNLTVDASSNETEPFDAVTWNKFTSEEKQKILLNYRLAYLSEAMVNWCPALGTVLANEEVKDGVSERGGHPVEKKLMKQWSLRISAYAERLLSGLDKIDWSESLKESQRNWIGKSEGAMVRFTVISQENASILSPGEDRGEASSATAKGYHGEIPNIEINSPTSSASPQPSPEERGGDNETGSDSANAVVGNAQIIDASASSSKASPQPSTEERGIDNDPSESQEIDEEDQIIARRWATADKSRWISLKEFGRENRRNSTPAETLIWSKLRNKQTGYKFRRQHAIGPFIVDFVCISANLIIEVDGEIHKFQGKDDTTRSTVLQDLGFNILRFSNQEILEDVDRCVQTIIRVLENASILSPGEDRGEASGVTKDLSNENTSSVKQISTGPGLTIEVFTTRPDTIFGATFVTLAPEHELVDVITTSEYANSVKEYVTQAMNRSERERMADVKKITGQFTGAYVKHPFTGRPIPVWVADYVLAGYGTGAVMAVPGHDSRDYAFAKHFGLEIIEVVQGGDISSEAYEAKEGKLINSDFLNGLSVKDAISKAIVKIKESGLGFGKTNYRLRDAVFGRQRYWGEPIPIYYINNIPHPLPEDQLPLILPEVDKFLPTETGEPPLARARNWRYKDQYEYELTTMPGWAGSSWYYLRYMDPHNNNRFASSEALNYWGSVDLYMGGSEHATGHLLYVRFWTKFLKDLGYLQIDEPARKLINQGMIQGTSCFVYRVNGTNRFVSNGLKQNYDVTPLHVDVNIVDNNILDLDAFRKWREEFASAEFILEEGKYFCGNEVEKMSKSKWNVVSPDTIIEQYGADCLRMYEMFLGPIEQSKPWNTNGITGVFSFLRKYWRLHFRENEFHISNEPATSAELKTLHKTIKKITDDMERFSFNTSISTFMICVNELTELKCNKESILKPLAILLAPFAPHIAEEIWHRMGNNRSITTEPYPLFDEKYLVENEFEYPVSINGKTRFKINLALNLTKEQVEKAVVEAEEMEKWLQGSSPKKVIVVPGRIVNVVV
jgi:leucyl-tRNA synthetase